MSDLSNLTLTAVANNIANSTIGYLYDNLQNKLANNGRDRHCKFYYSNGVGGTLLQVMAKKITGGVMAALRDEAVNEFNSLTNKKNKEALTSGRAWVNSELKKQKTESTLYGQMKVGNGVIYALDDWGFVCPDALMLGIELDKNIKTVQEYPKYLVSSVNGEEIRSATPIDYTNTVEAPMLVWYDTTAIITINSSKNLISTQVQGRDYSRKELVSNGDIKFSVSGQITSGKPDIFPDEEIKKFLKVMSYKGIIQVNNQILDQFGIKYIVITDYSLSPRQGYKAMQPYTFSGIGLQPEQEVDVSEDTIKILNHQKVEAKTETKKETGWKDILNDRLSGMVTDLEGQSVALITGILDNAL